MTLSSIPHDISALHIFNSLLLVLGALLGKRLAMLPWMIQVSYSKKIKIMILKR